MSLSYFKLIFVKNSIFDTVGKNPFYNLWLLNDKFFRRQNRRLTGVLPTSPAAFYAPRTGRSLLCLRAAKISDFLRRVFVLNRPGFRRWQNWFGLIINRWLLQKRLSVGSRLRNNFLILSRLQRLGMFRPILLYRDGRFPFAAAQISSQSENAEQNAENN